MARRVLIEYTQDQQSFSESRHEPVPIEKGTRRYVDPKSAEVLVKSRKVAKLVTEDEDRAATREAPKSVAPVKPEGVS